MKRVATNSTYPACRTARCAMPAALLVALLSAAAAFSFARAGGPPAGGATSAPAAQPPPVLRDLLAHGTSDHLWSADVVPDSDAKKPAPRTLIRYRTSGETQWRTSGDLEARVASLGDRGDELLVTLDNGEWMIASQGGMRSGVGLPGGADVLALTAAGDFIWAVGAAPPGKSAFDAPATRPGASGSLRTSPATAVATTSASPPATTSASATRPPSTTAAAPAPAAAAASQPSLPPHDVGVFRLARGGWEEVDALPAGVRRDDVVSVSLVAVERELLLAVATRDLAVRIFRRPLDAGAGAWTGGARPLVVLPADGRLKLMTHAGRPLLHVSEPGGPGQILVRQQNPAASPAAGRTDAGAWGEPIKLAPSPALRQQFDRRALASGLGRIRLVATDGKGRIAEQTYEPDGALAGAVTESVAAPPAGQNKLPPAVEFLVLAILFISMMGALRQRPNLAEAVRNIERLGLASLGRRLLGGLIDLLPLLICAYIGLMTTRGAAPAAPVGGVTIPAPQPPTGLITLESPEVAWVSAGIGIYFLHVLLGELLAARSLGKVLTGTRVAALDGSTPRISGILIRNLLRPLDVLLIALMLLSPLRQRVGDMAAGTIVVLAAAPPLHPLLAGEGAGAGEAEDERSAKDPPPPRDE